MDGRPASTDIPGFGDAHKGAAFIDRLTASDEAEFLAIAELTDVDPKLQLQLRSVALECDPSGVLLDRIFDRSPQTSWHAVKYAFKRDDPIGDVELEIAARLFVHENSLDRRIDKMVSAAPSDAMKSLFRRVDLGEGIAFIKRVAGDRLISPNGYAQLLAGIAPTKSPKLNAFAMTIVSQIAHASLDETEFAATLQMATDQLPSGSWSAHSFERELLSPIDDAIRQTEFPNARGVMLARLGYEDLVNSFKYGATLQGREMITTLGRIGSVNLAIHLAEAWYEVATEDDKHDICAAVAELVDSAARSVDSMEIPTHRPHGLLEFFVRTEEALHSGRDVREQSRAAKFGLEPSDLLKVRAAFEGAFQGDRAFELYSALTVLDGLADGNRWGFPTHVWSRYVGTVEALAANDFQIPAEYMPYFEAGQRAAAIAKANQQRHARRGSPS